MRSWKIGNVMGITLELHWTTILFMIFLVVLNPIYSLVFAILFVVISLHELSHSLVAKHYRIHVSKIILLPIGGMAVMEEEKLKPKVEFLMSIAGPLFNFCFAGLVLLVASTGLVPIYDLAAWDAMINGKIGLDIVGFIASSLFWLNWILGAFNLFVPAIPMDGGRVYRALLAMIFGYVKATRIAAFTSKIITAIMFFIAIFTFNIILLLVSAFIFLGASAEIEQAMNISALRRLNMKAIVKKSAVKVKPNSSIKEVIRIMQMKNVPQVFVGDYKHVITAEDVTKKGKTAEDIAREIKPVNITSMASRLDLVLKAITGQDLDIIPVVRRGRTVGFIYRTDLENALRLARILSNE